ncbi:hypothetical protein ACMHYO_14405 [Allopusillimonas ginsengisoli]|uniref:hypothetical protein n=1 Tax=Allopusillimonas ginsengisoli TaxID=453575 RepID=UPI0039C1049D
MTIPTDPAAQYAQLIERVANIADDIRELKEGQTVNTQLMVELASTRRDLSHTNKEVSILFSRSDKANVATAAIDKRLVGQEKWQRYVVAMASLGFVIAGWVWGWGWQYFRGLEKSMGDNERRISTVEFIVNSNNFERAMEPPISKQEGK